MKIYNKRGSTAPILLFVIMALVLFFTSILLGYNSNSSQSSKILSSRFVESVYSKEGEVSASFNRIGRESFVFAYEKSAQDIMNNNFVGTFEERFSGKVSETESLDRFFRNAKQAVADKKYALSYNDEGIDLILNDIVFAETFALKSKEYVVVPGVAVFDTGIWAYNDLVASLGVTKHSSIGINISFNRMGLMNLSLLSQHMHECSSVEDKCGCLGNALKSYFLVSNLNGQCHLESLNKYELEGVLRNLSFNVYI